VIPAFWQRNRLDFGLNAELCRLLAGLWTSNPLETYRAWGPPFDGMDNFAYMAPTDNSCPVMVVQWPTGTAIFAEGTDGRSAHITNLILGWLSPDAGIYGNGCSPAFDNASKYLTDIFPNPIFHGEKNLYLVGHSFGGGTLLSFHAREMGVGVPINIRTWTYGCPRPGNARFQQLMSGVDHTRWFGDDDPVRFIPPHADEVAALAWTETDLLANGVDTQVQIQDGWQIDANGDVANIVGNPNATTAVAYSIAGWCASPNGFGNASHSATTYQARFTRALNRQLLAQPAVPKQRPEMPLVITRTQLNQIRSRGEEIVLDAARRGSQPPLVVNVPNLVFPNAPRYTRKKVGKVWTVQLNGEVVAIGPGKRHAGTIKRRLNHATAVTVGGF